MAASDHAIRLRRFGLYLLVLTALLLGSAAGYVVFGSGGEAETSWGEAAELEQQDDPPVDLSRAPTIEFAERLRSYDWRVNALIDRFIRITRQGRYTEFRTLWTQQLDPVSADEYAHIWTRVRRVAVRELRPIPAAGRSAPPRYLLRCDVQLDESVPEKQRHRTIRMMIVHEEEHWVFAPPPRQEEGN